MSPWFTHLNLLLPLLPAYKAEICCVQIPSTYLTQGPRPQMNYLSTVC